MSDPLNKTGAAFRLKHVLSVGRPLIQNNPWLARINDREHGPGSIGLK